MEKEQQPGENVNPASSIALERDTPMKVVNLPDPVRYPRMSTDELRDAFLLDDLFQPGQLSLTYIDLDRQTRVLRLQVRARRRVLR